MTGLTPHRTIRRLRAVGRTFFALGTALILVAALAPLASAADSSFPSDDRATHHVGNFGAGGNPPNCASEYGVQQTQTNNGAITTTVTEKDVSTTLNSVAVTYEDTQAINVTANGVIVVAVVIKGGHGYNVYGPGISDMINPLNNSDKPAGLSHWAVCYRDPIADPAIVKAGPTEPVQLGATYGFELTITNAGENGSNTGPFTVSDSVPAEAGTVTGVSDDSAATECSNTGNDVTCSISDLSVEDTVTVTISLTAPSGNDDCGTVTNTASLGSFQGDNSSTANDSSSDDVTIGGCETITIVDPTPSIDVEKLVSLDGVNYEDADTGTGPTFTLGLGETQSAWFRVIVTNTSGDGTTVLTLNSLEDEVTSGDAAAIDLSDCTFPAGGLEDGDSITCDVGPVATQTGLQHTNVVTVSATGARQTVGDSDPANYLGTAQVGGVVVERPPAPAAPVDPPVGEPEPAPQVLGEELPRTGPADLWLAGLALMMLGLGLLTIARGKAMDATAYATGTWWTNRTP